MSQRLPVKSVVLLEQMTGGDAEDTALLEKMAADAKSYITSFPWCKSIRQVYFGDGYGGVIAIFFFHIESARADIDEWMWVIICDISPAYLVTDLCKTPSQALKQYIEEVSKWIRLAKRGMHSQEVIPIHISATPKNAADVERRLKILEEAILPAFREAEIIRS